MSITIMPAQHSLCQLAPVIRKDPTSWAGWSAIQMVIEIAEDKEASIYPKGELENMVKLSLKNRDYTTYFCQSGELVVVTEGVPANELRMLAKEVAALLRGHNHILKTHQLYNLVDDWRRFAFMCERKEARNIINEIDVSFDSEHLLVAEEAEELFAMYHQQDNETKPRTKAKVMVVEDDPLTRKIVSKVLKDEVDLVIASNLHEGLVHYALHMPDLVFLDINLERTNDGKIFLQTVREYDDHSQIVMFSGNSYLENRIDTLGMGANGFIAKPFRKEQLMHYIERVV